MKIVFLGTPLFSAHILEVITTKYQVALVITKPDMPVGRKQVITPSPVKEMALRCGLLVLTPTNLKDILPILDKIKPDLLITAAYGKMVPDSILQKYLTLNLHASILPKYRGGSPIEYALLNGDQETGITLMQLVKKMDAGPILKIAPLAILPTENKTQLTMRLSQLAAGVIMDYLKNPPTYHAVCQDESKATYAYNLTYRSQIIDYHEPVQKIFNKVRALSLTPGAMIKVNNIIVKIIACEPTTIKVTTPGMISLSKSTLMLACGDYYLKILSLQQAGKKVMLISDYLNGQKLFTNQMIIDDYINEYKEEENA